MIQVRKTTSPSDPAFLTDDGNATQRQGSVSVVYGLDSAAFGIRSHVCFEGKFRNDVHVCDTSDLMKNRWLCADHLAATISFSARSYLSIDSPTRRASRTVARRGNAELSSRLNFYATELSGIS